MQQFTTFVKQWLIPGSMQLLFLGIVIGVLLLNAGWPMQVLGHAWLTALGVMYWCLSLPAVAAALIARLGSRYGTINDPHTATGARVLVVVGNGNVHYTDTRHSVDYLTRRSAFCVFEAARVQALLHPELVIATGGAAGHPAARPESELMRDLLETCGVPAEQIIAEARSQTTDEQVTNVLAIVAERNISGPLIVVTTSAHMTRVVSLFETRGAHVLPSITPELRYDDGRTGWRRWWPSMAALTGSASAMYEYLANVQAAGRSMTRAR